MTDTVTVNMAIKLKPFPVPDHAAIEMPPRAKQDDMTLLPTIALEQLEPDVLDALAQRWLDNLYAACKRRSPFYLTPKSKP